MTTVIGCGCTPWSPTLSLRHSSFCPKFPNQALTWAELDAYHAAKLAEIGVKVRATPGLGPQVDLRSTRDPGYIDAHSDDEDDDGGLA